MTREVLNSLTDEQLNKLQLVYIERTSNHYDQELYKVSAFVIFKNKLIKTKYALDIITKLIINTNNGK